ncbi:MAG: Galactoside O-acetyltransferase [Alphaproteobacteria bacterium MarineAlpha5_Bin5]|nr:MAG: Galactoside O-acetyltransferase [Alphaproteobacteria bacterium MarineAlpha5_Bin5]PPR50620.1 MAG: Galactoside O-acetyltransferase [Alphaproteobacteria bacterium MarineAlpha5_Bin4]|tara:strand:+ start:2875 stop:3393 length:519 start_codon:yes stop_codon:yes gene_type:complete
MKKIFSLFVKKIVRRLVIYLRYSSFTFALTLRKYLYSILFLKTGKNFNILDGVIIQSPDRVKIGNNVSIHQFTLIDAQSEIEIGDHVAIGSHVSIISSSHIFSDPTKLIKDQGIESAKIEIGNNVWIGTQSTILKGVKIGDNSIIGANTLVNKDVPPNSIVGGSPFRVLSIR